MVLIRPQAYVFDLDGTLVDVSSIRHHVQGGSRDFDAFHTSAVNCPPVKWVKHMAIDRHMMGFKILLVTARSEKYRASTSWWIAENGVPSDELKMRGLRDGRPDYEVKKDILDRLLLRYDVVWAYDDNPSIVRLWSEYGIPCTVVPGWGE